MKPRVLKSQTPEFKKFLAAIVARRGAETSAEVDGAVSKIIAEVRKRGDRALIELTARFDQREADAGDAAGHARRTACGDQPNPG